MKRVFGIDVGGMSVKFAIVDETGTIIERWSVPTNLADAGSHIPDEMISSINEKLASSPEPIVAIGVGIPGPVNGEDVVRAVNLGWGNMPLGNILREGTGLPVALINDANAAAVGEVGWAEKVPLRQFHICHAGHRRWRRHHYRCKIVGGDHGCGGEIGHIPVMAPSERVCGCGNVNCLECYASATGIIKNANELAEKAGEERRFTKGEEIFEEVKQSGATATAARDMTVDYLARALAGIMATVDPSEVIVGGGLSGAGDLLMVPLAERLERYVFPPMRSCYTLRRATLGNEAGILGAAYQALQLV